jgi:hypothetical protein
MNVKLRTATTGKNSRRRDSTTLARLLYTHRSTILFFILSENYCNARELGEKLDLRIHADFMQPNATEQADG